MIKWYSTLVHGGRTYGHKDGGISIFGGKKIESLAREVIQNSLDAKLEKKEKVLVQFKLFKLSKSNFPDHENFMNHLLEAKKEGESLSDRTTYDFYSQAVIEFKKDQIAFLRISDFNTKGLVGSTSKGNNSWRSLVKSSGISDKKTIDGGSFGLGKNATFVCSKFRTVFYSTLDRDNIEAHQGVANLISVYDQIYDDYTQGTLFLSSSAKKEPILKQIELDKSFTREESGTDIYIPGFIFGEEEFNVELIKGILDNYLYAIFMDELEIEIGAKKIDKNSLGNYIYDYKDILNLETVEMFDLLINKTTNWFDDFENHEGVLLGLEIDDEGTRKISVIRKPWMKIKNFDGFSKSINFKGVLIIKNEKINAILREMENAEHNDFQPQRLVKESQRIGEKLLISLNKYINDKLVRMVESERPASLELIGASNYITLIEENNIKEKLIEKNEIKNIEVSSQDFDSISNQGIVESNDFSEEKVESFDPKKKKKKRRKRDNFGNDDLGKKVFLKVSNDLKVLRLKNKNTYKIFLRKENNKFLDFKIFAVNDEGTKIYDFFKIIYAKSESGKNLTHTNNIIKNVKGINNVFKLEFGIDKKELICLGVEIYEAN